MPEEHYADLRTTVLANKAQLQYSDNVINAWQIDII